MNELEERLAGAIRGSAVLNESRIRPSLGDTIENVKTPIDFDVEEDTTPTAEYSGVLTEEPRPVEVGYGGGYTINVEKLTSGHILKVGCQTIAVESGADVAKLIGLYLSEDKTIGDKWMNSDKIVQNFIKENLQVK